MKQIVESLAKMPKWYAAVAIIYSIIFAEFATSLNHYIPPPDKSLMDMVQTINRISYYLTIISGIVVWIISGLFFHLTALLFNGCAKYNKFLVISAYAYIIPAIALVIGIVMIDNQNIPVGPNSLSLLQENTTVKLVSKLINLSYIPYYMALVIFIRYLYNINWWKSLASVVAPVLAIWGISEIVKLL